MSDSDNPEFWVFRMEDGHAITSALTSHYDSAEMLEAEVWDPDSPRPEGTWSTETSGEWDANTRECLRGVCHHAAPTRKRYGKVELHPVKTAEPATEESWQEAIAKVVPVFELLREHVITVWEAVKPAVVGMVELCHRMRIEGDHDGLCPGPTPEREGQRCFCTCLACLSTAGECACAHCGCAVTA